MKKSKLKQVTPENIKTSPQTKYTGKVGKTDYILKNANLVNEQPKYAKGPITYKAKNNV
jgi:hypothetical protein